MVIPSPSPSAGKAYASEQHDNDIIIAISPILN